MISEMMGAIMVYTNYTTMLGDTRLWATGRWGHNVLKTKTKEILYIYIFSKVTR